MLTIKGKILFAAQFRRGEIESTFPLKREQKGERGNLPPHERKLTALVRAAIICPKQMTIQGMGDD